MNKLIQIADNELRLSSNLDEYSFGKTKYDSIISQEGLIFDGKNFKVWTFNDVKSFNVEGKKDRIVFYCGVNPLTERAKTLAEYFEIGGKEAFDAVSLVCKAITQAAIDKNQLPMVGAGGVLVDLSGTAPQLLFLPENLYKYSANVYTPEEYVNEYAGFINTTIYDLPALCFERAAIIYRLLTGKLPFASADPVERNADILDRKFLPLELCINGIDSSFAKEVNKALKLNSNAVNIPGKKQKGKSTEDLTPTAAFPLEKLEEAFQLSQNQNLSDSNFEEKVANYIKIRDSKIKTKRNLRRNVGTITGVFIIAVVIGIITANTITSNRDEYTSIGLTSTQTVMAFMDGVNKKDTILLSNFSNGKNTKSFVDTVSRIYVLHKQRLAYNQDNGFSSPEEWFLYVSKPERFDRAGIYGFSNLKIDGKACEPEVELKKINQNPAPLLKEGNIELTDKSESVHRLEYYLIHTGDDDAPIAIEKVVNNVTLTYKKNRWVITNFDIKSEDVYIDCNAFKQEYFEVFDRNEQDVVKTTDELRSKYKWIPTHQAVQKAFDKLVYDIQHPYAEIGL